MEVVMIHIPIVRNTYPFSSPCYEPIEIIGGILAAAGVISTGSSIQQGVQERKSQKSALAARASEIAGAEEKAALATSKAAKAAQTKLKKFRLSQTRSILTSPLGAQDEAVTGRTSLLGG